MNVAFDGFETDELLELEVQSRKRVRVLCGLEKYIKGAPEVKELDIYGLGKERTIQEFQELTKVNFSKQTVEDLWGGLDANQFEETQKQKKLEDVLSILAGFKDMT